MVDDAARFANLKGIAGPSLTFETLAGIISAEVEGRRVRLEITKPHSLKLDEKISIEGKELTLSSINTGVPHAILFLKNLENVDVVEMGRVIRFPSALRPSGSQCQFC